MNKKIIISALFIILILQAIIPQSSSKKGISMSEEFERLINFDTTTKISFDNDTLPKKPLTPGETYKDIKAKIEFKFERPWYYPNILLNTKIGKWILFRDTDFDMSVNITLSDTSPEWCDVELPKNIKIDNIKSTFTEKEITFNLSINETAKANLKDEIKIKASFKSDDNWGLKTSSSEKTFEINSAYIGKISAEFLPINTTKINLKENQKQILPLNITNNINDEIIVRTQITDKSKTIQKWNITIEKENITIPRGKNKIINITIKTTESDKKITGDFKLEFTPRSSTNETIQLQKIRLDSPKLILEPEDDFSDIITYVLYAIIILTVIAIILFILFRKKIVK